jgi:DNA mismatch endonuclease (patch repair protein)
MDRDWREPFASSDAVHRRMSNLARKDTGPEVALRRALHARGLRFFVHRRPLRDLRRTADVVFPTAKVAVFVDGCFWHGCPSHGRRQHLTNAWYWPEKIERNRLRDKNTNAQLRLAGWNVVRVWEHEPPEQAAEKIHGIILGSPDARSFDDAHD